MDIRFASLGYVQLTSLASAVGLAASAPATAYNSTTGLWIAQGVILRCETQNVRWRDDGTAPTATVGQLMIAGSDDLFVYTGPLSAIQFIQATAGAVLNCTFVR